MFIITSLSNGVELSETTLCHLASDPKVIRMIDPALLSLSSRDQTADCKLRAHTQLCACLSSAQLEPKRLPGFGSGS